MNNLNLLISNSYENIFSTIWNNKNIFFVCISSKGFSGDKILEPNLKYYNFEITTHEEVEISGQSVSFYLDFFIHIDFKALSKAYTKTFHPNNSDVQDLEMTEQSCGFDIFLENEWYNVIKHLKAFNSESDNYVEIAKLLKNFNI